VIVSDRPGSLDKPGPRRTLYSEKPESFVMTSRKIFTSALAFAIALALVLIYGWYKLTAVREPTSDEYLVYTSLIRHVATDDLFAKKRLAVVNQTMSLSLPNYDLMAPFQAPTPSELKITVIDDSSFTDFGDFCGRCAKDFVAKNLKTWSLRPSPDLSLVDAARPQMQENVAGVSVSRVGFNVSHNRAALAFEADCCNAEKSLLCLEIGKAFLKLENGRWTVERLFATLH
jgi:hypothetical protein